MLGDLSLWFSRRRVRGLSSVCIAGAALWAAVACGSDDSSSSSTDGAGGDGGSGGSNSAGGSGGDPSTDGDGGTSTSGDGGTSGSGGGSNSPGDFSSVWQAESAELMLFDANDPTGFESHTIDIPAKVAGPGDGPDVEVYVQFEGEYRITYAYSDGDPAYYRFSEPAISVSAEFYSVQSADGTHSYSIEDGKLTDIAQQGFGSMLLGTTTTTYRKVDDFPPSDWPSKVVTYEVGGAQ